MSAENNYEIEFFTIKSITSMIIVALTSAVSRPHSVYKVFFITPFVQTKTLSESKTQYIYQKL